jgi:hypothetical protein
MVTAMPSSTPPTPPSAESGSDSVRNCSQIWPQVAPSERRSSTSARLSSTEINHCVGNPDPADEQRHRAEAE